MIQYSLCGWLQIIAFQTKNTPKNMFILFIFVYLSFGEGEKRWNTPNAALRYDIK